MDVSGANPYSVMYILETELATYIPLPSDGGAYGDSTQYKGHNCSRMTAT